MAVLFLTHAYSGIRHDSILYFGQALLQLDPEVFANDFFFAYGSQARFTVFPRVIAWALQYGTPGQVSMGLTAVALLLFFSASAALLSALFSELPTRARLVALGLFCVVAFPPGYGAFFVFGYAEPFLTGRSFAEPLVLLAMAFLVTGRWLIAAGIALVAASIHPLQALPALLLIWADRIRVDRRWLWLITAAIPALLLAQAGVEPLSRLLDRYDSEWMSWIREPNRHVFLTQWPWPAWGQLLTDFFLLGVVARHAPNERVRRFAVLLFFVGLAMFSLAATLADALWLVLPTGLQLWRVQWLIHWTALALLPAVLLGILRQPAPQGGARRATLLLGVALLGMPAGRFSAAMAAPLAMLLFIGWPMVAQRTSARWQALAFWVVPLGVLIAYFRFALSLAPDPNAAHAERFLLWLLHPLPLAALALGAWRLLTVSGGPTRLRGALAVLLSCFLVVLAVNQWDQRSTLSRIVESTGNSGNPFAVELEADKQVYWYQDLLLPWLSLRRASFWNGLQGAGLLFNRGTAAAYHERETLTGLIEFQGQICTMLNAIERDRDRCTPDIELFTRLCNQSQLLGYVVLPFNLPRPALGTWHIPRSFDTDHEITYRLYACEAFR